MELPLPTDSEHDLPLEDEIDEGAFFFALSDERKGQGSQVPPNLRKRETDGPRCFGCVHYDGDAAGACTLYQYPVRADDVCDSYEARDVETKDAAGYTPDE